MSKASNSLKTSDVLVTPIKLKYQTSIASSSLESYGIKVLTGANGPIPNTNSISQEVLNYLSVKHLYYSNYLTGSLQVSASGYDNWLQSTAAFKGDPPIPQTQNTAQTRANVLDYGAIGDGTTNDTVAIQKAIDENEYVYIPTGNYLVDTLELKTNTNILGDGMGKSVLTRRYVSGDSTNPFNCLMLATSNSEQTKVSNIKINSLTLYGQSDVYGFSEFVHLLYLVGTDNVTVLNCEFKAFRGDGIDLGGYYLYNPGYGYPRHNSNVTISNCVFNGVNKENRNGISIIDCTGLLVENCEFKNCSKSNMPGAIDFEPDLYFNVIQNCIIRNNTFTNIGGNAGAICIAIVDRRWDTNQDPTYRRAYTVFPTNITIEGNTITNCLQAPAFTYVYRFNPNAFISDSDGVANILFKSNAVSNCATLFDIQNVNGLAIQDCTFTDCIGIGYISYPVITYTTSRNITISTCTFERCGTVAENGIRIFNIDTILIDSCQFVDCGRSTGSPFGNGIDFSGIGDLYCNSYNVSINNNIFRTPNGRMTYAIRKESNHTYHADTNEFNNNQLNGLPYTFYTSNVKTYGAKGDGVTNDTTAIQNAINANSKVYIPAGNYIVNGLLLKSNSNIVGDGIDISILTQTNIESPIAFNLLTIYDNTRTDQITIEDVTISGLTLNGRVETYGFSEPKALINATGVNNLNINNTKFLGFRGDGLLLNGYVFIGGVEPRIERHNTNVYVHDCIFNGVNKNNRNGISIIDNNGLLVENCQFKNTTRSDMPGAIDFEPDQDWCVVLNSVVRNCTFENIGGLGAILMLSPLVPSYNPPAQYANLKVIPHNFTIENNTIQNCSFVDYYGGGFTGAILYSKDYSNSAVVSNVLIKGNTVKNSNRSGVITSGNGITFQDNTYTNCTYNLDIHAVDNLVFSGNIISGSGTLGSAVTFFTMNNANINSNTFIDCGKTDHTGNAIFILNGTMYNTKINYNTFSSPHNITLKAIAVQGGVTFTGYQQFIGNTLNGLPSEYPAT